MGVTLSYNGLGGKLKFSGTSGKFKTVYTKPSLLSLYPGAAAAYSLRKLDGAYTGSAIRVSRSSDNAESNIGFNADGSLNTTALLSFVGSSNGRIATWYDQSGNARNATQATAGNQPLIVLAGTLYTLNGKPSVYWDNVSSQYLITANFASAISQPISTYTVSKVASLGINASVIYDSSTGTGFSLLHGGFTEGPPLNENLGINSGTSIGIEPTAIATKLVSVLYNTINTNVFVNGVQKVTNQNVGSHTLGGITIGNLRPLGAYNTYSFFGHISELVFYPSLQTANNTGIQSNINSYYTIYTPPSIDADAQAFFDRVTAAGGALTTTEQTAVNTLTLSLKSTGIWTKMRVIYPMVGASLPACSQNLKSSSYIGIFSGTWTYASTGVTMGSAADIEVPLNLNVMNSINDISYGYYCRNDISLAGSFGWGVGGGILNEFWIKYGDANRYGYLFDGANDGGAAGDSRGLNSISRIASNIKYIQKNATITAYSSVSSGTLQSRNFYFGRGSQGYETGRENAFGFVADGLTSINLSDLYNAVQAFQITLGRQV